MTRTSSQQARPFETDQSSPVGDKLPMVVVARQDRLDRARRPGPGGGRAVFIGLAALALAAVALLGHPRASRAQEDEHRGDGTWSGDEGSWESDAPAPGDPQDGDAPDNQQDAYSSGYRDGQRDAAGDTQRSGPTMSDFRGSLSEYGEWIDTPEYGTVWRPTEVASGWRPYLNGQWVWTTAGWAFTSDEPFGWAAYHYGRWASIDGTGWVWLPGRVWAPAWVAWRWGEGYAGWCPLGPRGYVWRSPAQWVFVEQPRFLEPVVHNVVPNRVAQGFWQRVHALPISRPGPHAGPIVTVVAGITHRPIHALPITDSNHPRVVTSPTHVTGSVVQMYRPRTRPILPQGQGGTGAAPSGGPHARPATSAGQGGIYSGGVPSQGVADRNRGPRAEPAGGRGGNDSEGPGRGNQHGGSGHAPRPQASGGDNAPPPSATHPKPHSGPITSPPPPAAKGN